MIPDEKRPKQIMLLLVTLVAAMLVLSTQVVARESIGPDAESQNMIFVGQYEEGYIGNEMYIQPAYAIVGQDGGVSVLRINSPGSLSKLSHHDTPQGFPGDITADGGLIYAAVDRPIGLGGDYLEVMVREDGNQSIESLGKYFPPPVQGYPITGITSIDKKFSPDYVYLGATTGLIIVDMFSKEDEIYNAAGFLETAVVRDLVVQDSYAYLATDEGLSVVSIGNPSSPSLVGSVTFEGTASSVAVGNGHAYVAVGHTLHIVNVKGGSEPKEVNTLILAGDNVRDMVIDSQFLYIAKGSNGVQVWYIGNPGDPDLVGMYKDTGFGASGVEVYNKYVYVSSGGNGIIILRNTASQPPVQARAATTGVTLNDSALIPGTDYPLNPQDEINLSGGAQVELTGDCVQDLVLLLLTAENGNPVELIPTLLANHPDLCSTLEAVRTSGTAAVSSTIALSLTQGAVDVSPQFEALTVEIATANAIASGQNRFAVSFADDPAITTVQAITGSVDVALANGAQPSITLPTGSSVEVTDAGFGPITSIFMPVYLPVIQR